VGQGAKLKYQQISKVCEACGVEYERKLNENIGNFKRNKTCSKECRYQRLKRNSMHIDSGGYLRFNRTKQRYHRFVMEQYLDRQLSPNEEVHHIDGNKLNNSVANLQVLSKQEHTSVTFKGKKRSDSWRLARGLQLS
jgi:hypothetical protein